MTALLIFLMSVPRPDWVALGLAVVLAAGLLWWELRASHPFLDVRLLASNVALTRTYLRWALIALCVYTVLYGITQWIQAGRGLSASEAGLLLLPMTAVSAIILGPISKRNLIRGPLIAGAAACLAGAAGVLFLTTSTPIAWILVVTLAFGVALGRLPAGTRPRCTRRWRPISSAPPRACSGPSATSAPSPHRPSSASSSTRTSVTTACTSSPSS